MSPFDGGIQIWFHQLYVEKEFRKMGINTKIFKFFQDKVKTIEGVKGINLIVIGENKISSNIYIKLGMKKSEELLSWTNFEEW